MHKSARILLLTSLAFATPLHAQTLYRCGKVFQDRPCESNVAGKVIGSGSAATQPAAVASTDPVCHQRGERAKRIIWARETGKTQDEQLATATGTGEQTLIREVYLMRGSSTDIAAAVTAKCAADREKALQAPAATAPTPAAPPVVSAPVPTSATSEQSDAAARKRQCDDIDVRLRGVQEQERAGGSAALMDNLRKQRSDLDNRRRAAGC